jgi:hypothetical protein
MVYFDFDFLLDFYNKLITGRISSYKFLKFQEIVIICTILIFLLGLIYYMFFRRKSQIAKNELKKIPFPSRNDARSILIHLYPYCEKNSISLNEMTSFCILLYNKKFGYELSTYIFTNALTDCFSKTNHHNEIIIDTTIISNCTPGKLDEKVTIEILVDFFNNMVGSSFEDWYDSLNELDDNYNVIISSEGSSLLDEKWFNNSEKFIHPLLVSYEKFKKEKGLLFLQKDMNQVIIDYSVISCFQHYDHLGYLNEKIIKKIIMKFYDSVNDAFSSFILNYKEIECSVLRDLTKPKSIKAAFDFNRQL